LKDDLLIVLAATEMTEDVVGMTIVETGTDEVGATVLQLVTVTVTVLVSGKIKSANRNKERDLEEIGGEGR